RELLHVQRGGRLVLPVPAGRLERRLRPGGGGGARRRRDLEARFRPDVPGTGARTPPLPGEAPRPRGGRAGEAALHRRRRFARCVLPSGAPPDVPGRAPLAAVVLDGSAPTIARVSSLQDGSARRGLRAP